MDKMKQSKSRFAVVSITDTPGKARESMQRANVADLCVEEDGCVAGFVDVERLTLANAAGANDLKKAVDATPGIIHWTRGPR